MGWLQRRREKKKDKIRKPFGETKFGKFAKKVGSKIPEIAGDVIDIATSPNPIGTAIDMVKDKLKGEADGGNEQAALLLHELERDRMTWEKEMYEIEVEDRKSARNMYMTKSGMADRIASQIINWNLPAIAALVVIEILTIIYMEDKTLIAIISSAVGGVTTALINERLTVIQFFFGSSKGSKDKQKVIEDNQLKPPGNEE